MFLEHLKENISKKAANIFFIFLIIFIIFFFYLLYFFISSFNKEEATPVITSSLISSRIENTSDISSVKYMYTNFGKFENSEQFKGITIPFSQKSFIISYDGIMQAGISVDDIEINVSGDKIYIDLPSAKILSHEIKEDSIEVFDETKNIFNQISINDYANFTIAEKQKMEKKAIENGLLIEAQKEAEKTIKHILMMYPDIYESKEIIFEDFNSSN